MTNSNEELTTLYGVADRIRDNLEKVILGKPEAIELSMLALFCAGNVLLEDVPGVGKTTLAKAVAKSVSMDYRRIQFTPDMLPADILGGSIFNPKDSTFTFKPGPIFTNILLADEINRASPRTQSALLEAMSEGHATIEGEEHSIQKPFMVIATQNPVEFHGTYPLPEAQLDRFLLKLVIGYPEQGQEVDILYSQQESHPIDFIEAVTDRETIVKIQEMVRKIPVDRSIGDYIVSIINTTRNDDRLILGASPRASLNLFHIAQARAFLSKRNYVIPDDVKHLAEAVLSHRISVTTKAKYGGADKSTVIKDIINQVRIPV